MSKSILLFVIILFLFGCKKKQQETKEFECIDYSFWWGYYRSVKIFSNGETYVYYSSENQERESRFGFKISKTEFDSISKMVKNLNIKYPDSIYQVIGNDNEHGISTCLLIKLHKSAHLMINKNQDQSEKEIKVLRDLKNFLDNLTYKVKRVSDSAFVFESMNYLSLPPPPEITKLHPTQR
jgi:hypothetical protein